MNDWFDVAFGALLIGSTVVFVGAVLFILLRAALRSLRSSSLSFGWWREAVVVLGVAMLAYAAAGIMGDNRNEDEDRVIFTLGAAMTIGAILWRRRLPERPGS